MRVAAHRRLRPRANTSGWRCTAFGLQQHTWARHHGSRAGVQRDRAVLSPLHPNHRETMHATPMCQCPVPIPPPIPICTPPHPATPPQSQSQAYPIPCHPIPSHPVLSNPIQSHPIQPRPIQSNPMQSTTTPRPSCCFSRPSKVLGDANRLKRRRPSRHQTIADAKVYQSNTQLKSVSS